MGQNHRRYGVGLRKPLRRKILRRKISLAKQSYALLEYYPQFKANLTPEIVTWVGEIQPSPLSEIYTIKIELGLTEWPKVWVLSPPLNKRGEEETIPHMYGQERLCLFYPKSGEWSRDKWVYRTIIPWTCLWLYHYEIWHITGEWLGGGIHPIVEDEADEEDQ